MREYVPDAPYIREAETYGMLEATADDLSWIFEEDDDDCAL